MSLIHLIDDYGITLLTMGVVRLESIPATNEWLTLQPIIVSWVNRFGPQKFTIPSMMKTDLASVPLSLQSFVSPCGSIKDPAVMHDGLYQYRPELSNGERIGRAEADWLLYKACRDIGQMGGEESWNIFTAVRIAGSVIWHRHDKEFDSVVDV